MNLFIILGNYLKTSIRNIGKNKAFTLINIIGLAISMSVGMVILTLINEVNSYDNFHEKSGRIYRVSNVYQYLDEDPSYYASTSPLAGKKIQEGVTGIEDLVLIRRYFSGDFGEGEKRVPLEGLWASESFFNIFTFKMLKGNPATALKNLNSLVLTESAAEKLFGDEDPLGKSVALGVTNQIGGATSEDETTDFQITGIVEDPPPNSTLDFEMIGSFITHEEERKDNPRWMRWSNMWMYHVYFLVEERQDIANIQAQFDKISNAENERDEYTKIHMTVQAMEDITPGPDLSNEIARTMDSRLLWMLAGLTFIVIISACFNYTNLSIARSLRRSKEVGIRKVVGASRVQIFNQFIFESILVTMLALVLSFGLFYLIKPNFLGLNRYISDLVSLDITGTVFIQFIILAIITGLLAGFLPAVFFARMSPESILKSASSVKLFKGLTMRKILIVFQFTLSLMFIVAATLEYKQYRYALAFDLGYETENILNIRLQDNDPEILKAKLEQLPEVEAISQSLLVTSVGNYWSETLKYLDPMDSASVYYNGVDEHYIPLHNHLPIAGSNFSPTLSDSTMIQVIVNEQVLDRFNLGTPDESIGEVLKFNDDDAVIVGVIEDFHYGTLRSEIRPFLFKYESDEFYQLNVKLRQGDLFVTMDKIEAVWKSVDDVHPMNASLYDDRIEETYSELAVMVRIIGFLAFLAITIAIMGLLGMVMFTTETRLKEISIRKVLGATEQNLIILMGRGFLLLLVISAIVAIPTTYLVFDKLIFSDIAYRVNIGLVELLSGTVLVFIVATIAVGSQTIQAARTNPASTLRNE